MNDISLQLFFSKDFIKIISVHLKINLEILEG